MGKQEDFFSDLKEWSARKLNIVKKYVGGFSKILGSRFGRIYYVDGFAGRGVYEDGQQGSPVLAAEASLAFQKINVPFTLLCINVEKDQDNFRNLSDETQRFGNLVENVNGAFEENIDGILARISGNPAVFFIDDFGIKGTGWTAVERVIGRNEPTDIWIRFDHKTALRLAGFQVSGAREADGKLSTLEGLFGMQDREHLLARLKGNSPEERVRNAVGLYIENLEGTFSRYNKTGFAASYPIVSIDGLRKYHLVFACSHYKAATLASNIVNGIEETFQREKEEYEEARTMQPNLFPPEITKNEVREGKVRNLRDAIMALPKNTPLRREVLQFRLLCREKALFGKFGKGHLTQALKDLLNETIPRIACGGTPGSDEAVITILE